MKLGVLGGSFNPVHNGHIAMAEAARDAHGLDRVLLVPAGMPPHKRGDLAEPGDRLAMVRLSVQGRRGLEASAIELDRPGLSYTVETLEALAAAHPDAELFFILGADSIPELPGWRNAPRILELARIVAINRPGREDTFLAKDFPLVSPKALARLNSDRVAMPPSPCESRRIRELVRSGAPIDDQVPASVARYIEAHGLYRS